MTSQESGLGSVVLAFLSGATLGAVIARNVTLAFLSGAALAAVGTLLLAPQSGAKSREQLQGYVRRAKDNVHTLADEASIVMEELRLLAEKDAILTRTPSYGRRDT